MMQRVILIVLVATVLSAPSLKAQSKLPSEMQALRIDQKMGEQVPLNLRFTDETGTSVTLDQYFGERPVLLILAYYKCPRLCSQVLNGVVASLKQVPLQVGNDYTIVTVSIDPKETPELAMAKRQAYINQLAPNQPNMDWHFLTGDETAIKRLADAVGYHYVFDSSVNQYRHSAAIMILTPKGEVSHYFFGINFPARDVHFGLVEASQNRISAPVTQVLLLTCFSYDPLTGKYGASAMKLMRVGAVVTVLCLAIVLGRLWWKERHKVSSPQEKLTPEPQKTTE